MYMNYEYVIIMFEPTSIEMRLKGPPSRNVGLRSPWLPRLEMLHAFRASTRLRDLYLVRRPALFCF